MQQCFFFFFFSRKKKTLWSLKRQCVVIATKGTHYGTLEEFRTLGLIKFKWVFWITILFKIHGTNCLCKFLKKFILIRVRVSELTHICHHYHLDTFNFRGVRSIFSILFHLLYKFLYSVDPEISKQCRPRWDAAICVVSSGSMLFAYVPKIGRQAYMGYAPVIWNPAPYGAADSGDIAGLKCQDLTSNESQQCRRCAGVLIPRENSREK